MRNGKSLGFLGNIATRGLVVKLLLVFISMSREGCFHRMEDLETPIQLILGLRFVIDLMILGMVASPDLLLNQLSDVFNFRV